MGRGVWSNSAEHTGGRESRATVLIVEGVFGSDVFHCENLGAPSCSFLLLSTQEGSLEQQY